MMMMECSTRWSVCCAPEWVDLDFDLRVPLSFHFYGYYYY